MKENFELRPLKGVKRKENFEFDENKCVFEMLSFNDFALFANSCAPRSRLSFKKKTIFHIFSFFLTRPSFFLKKKRQKKFFLFFQFFYSNIVYFSIVILVFYIEYEYIICKSFRTSYSQGNLVFYGKPMRFLIKVHFLQKMCVPSFGILPRK